MKINKCGIINLKAGIVELSKDTSKMYGWTVITDHGSKTLIRL